MDQVTIYTDNSLSVGTTITGYMVSQRPEGTVLVKTHNNGYPLPKDFGDVVKLPHHRYSLCAEKGFANFEKDFLALWNSK
jgi:hypothetical protein